jgi:hypothetical protein
MVSVVGAAELKNRNAEIPSATLTTAIPNIDATNRSPKSVFSFATVLIRKLLGVITMSFIKLQ